MSILNNWQQPATWGDEDRDDKLVFEDNLLKYLLKMGHKSKDDEIAKAMSEPLAKIKYSIRYIKQEQPHLFNYQEFSSGLLKIVYIKKVVLLKLIRKIKPN